MRHFGFYAPDDGATGGAGSGADASVLLGGSIGSPAPAQPQQTTASPQQPQPPPVQVQPQPQPPPAQPPQQQQQQQQPPAYLVDGSGNLAPNWRDALPEALRGEKTLENFKNLEGLASALVSTKRMVGQNTIKLPNEHSSEADWQEFFSKCGRPAKADDYQFDRDQRLPDAIKNSPNVAAFRKAAYDLGLTPKQVSGLVKMYDGQVAAGLDGMKQKAELDRQTNIAALKTEWGDHFDANLNLATMALNVLDPKQELVKQIPVANPAFIKLLAKVAPWIGGDAMVNAPGGNTRLDDIETEMSAIQNNPAYRDAMNPDQPRLIARYSVLAQQRAQLRQTRKG